MSLQWYSFAELGVTLDRETLRRIRPPLMDRELRVTAVALSYPEGEVQGAGLNDVVTVQGETAVTVGLDFPHDAVGETVIFYVSVVDAAVGRDAPVEESLAGLLAASDPVSVTEDGLAHHRPAYEPGDRCTSACTRVGTSRAGTRSNSTPPCAISRCRRRCRCTFRRRPMQHSRPIRTCTRISQ